MAESRKQAQQYGRFGELLGSLALRFKGYRILARGYRTPVGEIDLVARRGEMLVFIEVKARRDITTAATAIHRRQQNRIIRAAQAYVQEHANLTNLNIRFDALLVSRNQWPVHVVDAWRPED